MIKSISLKNFRSHKDTFIEFHSGVNVFTGDNDAGKTNILRAINWVVNNRPSGEDIQSNWGGPTSVHIDIGGKLVGRHRNKGENLYTLTHEDDATDAFKAFGMGVPEEISQHLNIQAVNIHSQLEGPFLLNQSPAEVARYYNNLVNLDIIDRSISNIGKVLRSEKTSRLNMLSRTESLKEDLKEYEWLPKAEGCLVKLEHMQQEIYRTQLKKGELSKLIENLSWLISKIKQIQKITKYEQETRDLLSLDESILSLRENKEDLASYIRTLKTLKAVVKDLEKAKKFEREVARLLEFDDLIAKDTERYNKLLDMVEDLEELAERNEALEAKKKALQAEFDELMPDVCPLCGK